MKIYLLPCCSKKLDITNSNFSPHTIEELTFNNEIGEERKILLSKINNASSHTREVDNKTRDIPNNIDFGYTIQAHKLYSKGKLYGPADSINWNNNQIDKIYIISALFGIIKASDFIPSYDFAIGDKLDGVKINFWKNKLDDIVDQLTSNGNQVYNLLGGKYERVISKKYRCKLNTPNINFKSSDGVNRLKKRGEWLKQVL